MKNKKIEKITKLKEEIIRFFKNPKEVVSFFLPIIITICLIIPMPYYVKLGGGTIKLDNKIEIEGEKEDSGSLEALYVSEGKAIVLTYLLSYVVPSFEREKVEDVILEEENEEDYTYREKLYFTSSLDAATKVAFEKAGKEVMVSSSKFLIVYIDKEAKTELEVGDQIIEVEGKSFSDYEELATLISENSYKEEIKLKVIRDNKEITVISKLIDIEGEKKLGIVISNEIKYTSNPKVEFNFNGKQAGPSGGLMIALTIYNKLVDEDITKGKKVVGTGTIDTEGNVGEIGGIRHKLMAANRKNADIVFVPEGNYKEASKLVKEKDYKFKLFSVKTFDDAVNFLEKN